MAVSGVLNAPAESGAEAGWRGHTWLHPYISEHAAEALQLGPSPPLIEIEGSLAFFDISGFTPLTERLATLGRAGAEHINDVLNTVFTGLIEITFEHGGDVLEFGGDAMVVLYTGEQHARSAAMAAAAMHRFMARKGRVATPAGRIALGMSCGMASGTQAYYLLGTSRRAFVVAGPVSTAMARLEEAAGAGETFVDTNLADQLPGDWTRPHEGGALRLDHDRVRAARAGRSEPIDVRTAPATDTTMLLPVQFRGLSDVGARGGELKQVAMAFIRLDGTDDMLADGGPEAVCRRLGDISNIVDMAAGELDVCWLETQAEANSVRWTLISGAPTATERDGERLLRVVRRIADASPLPLRIGANLGVVFVGDMGHPQRCTYIVMGDATNLAARLMGRAMPGEIIAGERLVDASRGRFETIELDPFTVKGKQRPVRAARIGALLESSSVGSGAVGDHDRPMLGRRVELDQLVEEVGNAQTIEIVGEAGTGKTRLWQEARRVGDRRPWHVTRAELHERAATYLPIRRLIRAIGGIPAGADDRRAGELLAELVATYAADLRPWLPLLADVIGATVEDTDEVDALDPNFRADRLQIATVELIAAITRPAATIVVEDVHWLDDASRLLMEVLVRTPNDHLAVVMTRRPDGWEPPCDVTIELLPFEADLAEQLLIEELPASAASDATLERLKRSGAGNPLYLIELARAAATASADEIYPESIERMMAARIDQLSTANRALIRDASVLGSTINRRLAAAVLERPELAESEVWERAFGDLITIEADDVRFRHDLVRVAAYEGLSVRRRRAVHARAGDVIQHWGAAAPLADPVAALAFHASGSGIAERIVEWNRRAADAAVDKGAMLAAEPLLAAVAAAQLTTRAPREDRVIIFRQLAMAAERAGHPTGALDATVRASRLATGTDRARIAVDRVRLLEKLGRYRTALSTTARALSACDDPLLRADLMVARATVFNFRGEWNRCLTLTREVIDRMGAIEERVLAQAHLLSEWCCTAQGLDGAAHHADEAERLLTQLDDSIGLANLYLNRGVTACSQCRIADAIADFGASSQRYERAGDVVGAALADNNMAEQLTVQHRLEQAEQLLVPARRVLQAANYPLGIAIAMSGLSRIAAWRGNTDEALRLQSDALEGFRALEADDYVADSLTRLVEIHLLVGDTSAALSAYEDAAASVAALGEIPLMPATLSRLHGRVLTLAGSEAGARDAFEAAIRLAERDQFAYEVALASIGLGRLDQDQASIDAAHAVLADLDVLAPPPGT